MKKLVILLLLAITGTFGVSAQQIPANEYSAKPSGPAGTTEIETIEVNWSDISAKLTINYNTNGLKDMRDMTFQIGDDTYSCVNASSTSGTNSFVSKDDAKSFVKLEDWISFAKEMKARFVRLSPRVYVETKSFKVVGETILLGQVDTNLTKVITLESGKHLRSIRGESWIGEAPARGMALTRMYNKSENLIGFTDDGKWYFLVEKQKDGNFYFDRKKLKKAFEN